MRINGLTYILKVDAGPGYQPLSVKVKPGSDKTYRLKLGYLQQGQLLDEKTGWPIPGVHVLASDKNQDTYRSDEPTDRQGRFVFTTLNKGRYGLYINESRSVGGKY